MMIMEDLEKVLLTEVAVGLEKQSLDPDENLLEQGIIDSLGLMKLITFMEATFGIKIIDEDIIPENFQSLTSMAMLVKRQMGIM